MSEVINLGGRKYKVPDNIELQKELMIIMRNVDVSRFREFIKKNIIQMERDGWVEKEDHELAHFIHEYRSQMISFGEDFWKSRNYLRAEQFGYAPDEADMKPLCAGCRWFREAPKEGELPCMHLGSIPQDICCKAYEKLSTQ